MKSSFFLLLILLTLTASSVQSQINTDSLQDVLKKTKNTKHNLQNYLNLVQIMGTKELEAARITGEWIIRNAGSDSLTGIKAGANLALGKIYTNAERYGEAAVYLTAAQGIAEKNDFPVILAQTLNALGVIYKSNEQYEKAADYFKQSIAISTKSNYMPGIARAKFNLGNLKLKSGKGNPGNWRASVNLMLEGYHIVMQLKDTQSIFNQSNGLAAVYAMQKKYDSSLLFLKNAEVLMKAAGKESGFLKHCITVAGIFITQKKYQKAIEYYHTGLVIAEKYNIPRWMCQYYTGIAGCYEKTGDYKKANYYNQLNIKMHEAMVSKENFAAAADIQNKYDREKKDNEIFKLAALNKQRSVLNKVLIGSSFGLLLLSFLGYRNFKKGQQLARQQQILHVQRIKELEKDKQFLAVDAMLKGQEEERSRIAKDLHDGLGSLLSGTKLSFMNVKDNVVLTPNSAVLFDKSLSMLDNTINDLRKVAHNLMPEALVKFGLAEALRDFCNTIQSSTGIKVKFHEFGEKRKLDNTAEVFAYRIIQELVNNAIRHAGAGEIIVQLALNDTKIGITVEDDGNGFDKNNIPGSKGAGMANINYRVQYLNGTSDIVSSPGNGTSVHIELRA